MSGEHSLLSPSGASRYLECLAAPAMCMGLGDTESAYADEGTRAHEIAERCLRENLEPAIAVLPGEEDFIEPLARYIGNVHAATFGAEHLWYEQKVDLSHILGTGEGGTADVVALVPTKESALEVKATYTLVVIDLKYGKGVPVSAANNPQLMLYALGAYEMARLLGYEITGVVTYIEQPRLTESSCFAYSLEMLADFAQNVKSKARVIKLLVDKTLPLDDTYFAPGEKTCRFCAAAKTECCPARQNFVLRTLADEFGPIVGTDDAEQVPALPAVYGLQNRSLSPFEQSEVVGRLLPKLDLIRAMCKTVEDRAMELALLGVKVPGYKLVAGREGNREWTDAAEAEKRLKAMSLKVGQMYKKKLISPTEAEKVMRKKMPLRWDRIQELVSRAPAKPALVEESDGRPSLLIGDMAEKFEVEPTQSLPSNEELL